MTVLCMHFVLTFISCSLCYPFSNTGRLRRVSIGANSALQKAEMERYNKKIKMRKTA